MKMLTVSLLVCAMMALTRAAAVPEAETDEKTGPLIEEEENHMVKRSLSCPIGWADFSGRCFLYVPTFMTWGNAERHCQLLGGNLASVHSFDEHKWIQSMILKITRHYPTTWLGGSDAEQRGTWFWSDGTPFRFNYWAPGQPNKIVNARCLLMNFGAQRKFGDQACFYIMPFVCVKKSM